MAIDGNTKVVFNDTDKKYYYDTSTDGDNAGKWDTADAPIAEAEIQQALRSLQDADGAFNGQPLGEVLKSVSELSLSGDDSSKAGQLLEKLESVMKQLEAVQAQLKKGSLSPESKQTLEIIEKQLKTEAQELFNSAKQYDSTKNQHKNTLILHQKKLAKMKVNVSYEANPSSSSEQTNNSGGGAKAAYNPNAQQGGAKAAAWGPQAGFNMGWQTGGPGGGFNFNAYANSMYTDQAILSGFDQVGKNAANQKKMMMMFFYFAQQAMSGDMGAMYRFMQFITYIISKDKAMQNIHMASKLIEMENSSRAALEELLKQPTPDGQDQGASFEFTKVMERTKAHQSSIAMSQKLIAQMMEEMSQVVESLTGSTKAALDANGRILQRLTRG